MKIERERNMGARRHNNFGRNGIHDRNRRDNRSRTRERERDHRGYNRDPMNGSFDMREGCSYEPEQHRMRVINRVFYEHEPVEMRKRMRNDRNNPNQRHQDPARKGNTYFDHNGLDDIDNLSFEYREEESRQSHGTNLDMSFNFGENPAASSKAVDMSFNLADDLDVSSKKAVDMSFNFGENGSDNKSMLKQDMSFVMNSSVVEKESKIDASFAMGKSEGEKEAVDASFLFEKEEASPIHHNPLDAGDFPMFSDESILCKTNSGLSLLNRKT